VVARVGPVAEMISIVEDAVRFDVADSAPRAAITSSKPQNVSDAPLAPSRRATTLEKSEIAHGRSWSVWAELPPCLAERTLVVEPERSLDQRSNQAQEFLLLRSVVSCDEKGSDLNVGALAT